MINENGGEYIVTIESFNSNGSSDQPQVRYNARALHC